MDHLAINKQSWDRRAEIHVGSEFYNVAGFLGGQSTLNPVELELLGDLQNKSLLHMQCHFGMDTLSLARLGAKVTGVDLSSTAIEQAQQLAQQANLDARFIASDVLQLRDVDNAQYDIVYTSYGVLCWLPDLTKWAEVVAASLKPGGEFHLVEFHPFFDVMAGYNYFHDDEALVEQEATYTENSGDELQTIVTWTHALSDVISALINVGLVIEEFKEYDSSPYDCFEGLTQNEQGQFQYIQNGRAAPVLYSVKAKRPENDF